MHMSKNIGATTASRKLDHDKIFLIFSQKGAFKKKKIALHSNKVITLNLYIDINELISV